VYRRPVAGFSLLAVIALSAATAAGCGSSSGESGTTGGAPSGTAAAGRSVVSVLGSRVGVSADRVTLDLGLRQPEGVDPPIARTATVTLPAGVAFDGGAQKTCAVATVRSGGVGACAAASIIGSGRAVGTADTARINGAITILNAGPDTVLFATVVRNPAYVKTVVVAKLAPAGDSGALRVAFRFPRALQEVGGVPVGLEHLQLTLRRGPAITIGKCPSAEAPWRYSASVAFEDRTTTDHAGAASCR
jgi:hypothetical protein